jgi:hypothetical protein
MQPIRRRVVGFKSGRGAADHDTGGPEGPFDTFDAAGNAVRYTSDDLDEIYTTADAPEMRRLVKLGWLLLDERVARTPGKAPSWIDTALRRSAGRVLPAQDDPAYEAAADVTSYVLGHLKPGAVGTGER